MLEILKKWKKGKEETNTRSPLQTTPLRSTTGPWAWKTPASVNKTQRAARLPGDLSLDSIQETISDINKKIARLQRLTEKWKER